MNSKYINKVVGIPLNQCLTELVLKAPPDPIEWIAHWLYRYIDQEMHFYEKSIFIKELYCKQLELDKERENRLRFIAALNDKIMEIKESIGQDMRSASEILRNKVRESQVKRAMTAAIANNGDSELRGGKIFLGRNGPGGGQWPGQRFVNNQDGFDDGQRRGRGSYYDRDGFYERMRSHDGQRRENQAATWQLDRNRRLSCDHPILGLISGRAPFVPPESPAWWESQSYIPQSFYDHEVYSTAPFKQDVQTALGAETEAEDKRRKRKQPKTQTR